MALSSKSSLWEETESQSQPSPIQVFVLEDWRARPWMEQWDVPCAGPHNAAPKWATGCLYLVWTDFDFGPVHLTFRTSVQNHWYMFCLPGVATRPENRERWQWTDFLWDILWSHSSFTSGSSSYFVIHFQNQSRDSVWPVGALPILRVY